MRKQKRQRARCVTKAQPSPKLAALPYQASRYSKSCVGIGVDRHCGGDREAREGENAGVLKDVGRLALSNTSILA